MELKKRGNVWHYSFTVGGERVRQSSKTADKALAQDIATAHYTRLRRAAVHGPQAELTFADAINLYYEHKPDARYLLPLLNRFGRKRVADITQPMVRQAAREIYPGCSAATWNRQVITPFRAVVNFAAEEGLCEHFRMKRFAEGEKKRRPAGDKQWLKAFQKQCKKQKLPHLAALARFMFETGARIGQACELTWDDVDLQKGAAILTTKKTGANGPQSRERVAWLTPAMVAEIANIENKHPRKVFGYASRNTAAKTWPEVVKNAGIAPLTPHEAGRHGFATEMVVRAGKDIATAAERGGWASKRLMLETYVHGREDRGVIDEVFGTKAKRNK